MNVKCERLFSVQAEMTPKGESDKHLLSVRKEMEMGVVSMGPEYLVVYVHPPPHTLFREICNFVPFAKRRDC